MQYRYEMESPLGRLRLCSNDDVLTGVYFDNHNPAPKVDDSGRVDAAPFAEVVKQLQQYFVNERDEFDLKVAFDGTEFQEQVLSLIHI